MTVSPKTLPYGSWPSPLPARQLTALSTKISEPRVEQHTVYWLESRPQQGGRTTLVRKYRDKEPCDILAEPYSIRTRANEYGGGAWTISDGAIYAVLDHDQRIYQIDQQPRPITPEGSFRYADLILDKSRQRLICVREDYRFKTPRSEIVAVDLTGNLDITVLVSGDDFYSNPRVSPDGNRFSWLSWNHPNMPWDGTACRVARIDQTGLLAEHYLIAGGDNESIFQPEWSPAGMLFFVSDRSNWWNLYQVEVDEFIQKNSAAIKAVYPHQAEFATPQWVFGISTYAFPDEQTLLCCFNQQGQWHLASIDLTDNQVEIIQTPLTDISAVFADGDNAVFIGANAVSTPLLYQYRKRALNLVSSATPAALDPAYISVAQPIVFSTTNDDVAHAFYYAPVNPTVSMPANILPPLIVMCHGGPTGATESSLNLKIQYWTTRGFAVLDVNYRGSTGYGRTYRDALKGRWGIADVDDVVMGATCLADRGLVNPEAMIIRGSSAGGYTVLAALTFTNRFAAGASLYGIGNLETLVLDTHKFEARYLDSLIGAYPADRPTYIERSPLFHVEQLKCPVIFLQGLRDKVVPPEQAGQMVAALARQGIPHAYVTFPDEGHGFRQADAIVQALESELYFYSQIFHFTPADNLLPVVIHGLSEDCV